MLGGPERRLRRDLAKRARFDTRMTERLVQMQTAQADKLVATGFHTELELTEQQYRDSLPQFTLPPVNYAERGLTQPLLVDPRIPFRRQVEMAGVRVEDYTLNRIREVPGETEPYAIWIKPIDIKRLENLNIAMKPYLLGDYRYGSLTEALALYLQTPKIKRSVYAPGSSYGEWNSTIPCITTDRGAYIGNNERHHYVGHMDVLIRGSEVTTKGSSRLALR